MPDVIISTGGDNSALNTSLAELRNYGSRVKTELSGIFATTFAVSGLVAATQALVDYGGRLQDLSERFSVSTTSLQQFGNAAALNGVSLDQVALAFKRLDLSREQALRGDKEMIAAFENLNIAGQDLRDLTLDQIMLKMGTSSMNTADSVRTLGRDGTALRTTLQGLEGDVNKLGSAMDPGLVKRLDQIGDRFTKVKQNAGIGASVIFDWATRIGALTHGIGLKTQEQDDQALAAQKPKRPAEDLTPLGNSAEAGGGGSGSSSRLNLADLERKAYLDQLSALEKVQVIKQEQADIQEQLNLGIRDGTSDIEEEDQLRAQILEKDVEIKKVQDDQAKAEAAYREERERVLSAAEEELAKATERNLVAADTVLYGEEVAKLMADQREIENEIEAAIDAANQAWAEGDQTVAETNTKLAEQLKKEKEITQEQINREKNRRAAEKERQDAIDRHNQGVDSISAARAGGVGLTTATFTDPRIAALMQSGFQISEWAITMATNVKTGVINMDDLIRRILEYNRITDFGKKNVPFFQQAQAAGLQKQFLEFTAMNDRAAAAAAVNAQRQLGQLVFSQGLGAFDQGGALAAILAQLQQLNAQFRGRPGGI